MNKFFVCTEYAAGSSDVIELPDGVTFEDIKDYNIKWHMFNYTLDGKEWHEIELVDVDVDYKRPIAYSFNKVITDDDVVMVGDEIDAP